MKKSTKKQFHLGLDLSLTATGYCVSNKSGKFVVTGIISSNPDDKIEDRILSIWLELSVVLKMHRKELALMSMEGLAFGSKGQRRDQLAGLHYYVRIMVTRKYSKLPLLIIAPTTLKKFVTGKGQARKNLMLLECYKKFEFEASDDNICDAYCLTRYTFKNETSLLQRGKDK